MNSSASSVRSHTCSASGGCSVLTADGSCGVPLALAALCSLSASRRQGEHLVAVEGAPDTGLTTRGQVTTGDHLGDGLWVDTENRRGLGLHDPHAQVSSYATRRRSRACSRTAAAVSRLVVAPEFMAPF